MVTIYYIDTEELSVKTMSVDNRLSSEDLNDIFGEGLWFEEVSEAQDELDVILFNLDLKE